MIGGLRGIAPGAMTGSIFCSLIQVGYNELRIWRVRYVSQEHAAQQTKTTANTSYPQNPTDEFVDRPTKPPTWQRLLSLMGVHKLSDEERIEQLKNQRDTLLDRIAVLEEEERRRQAETPSENEEGKEGPSPT